MLEAKEIPCSKSFLLDNDPFQKVKDTIAQKMVQVSFESSVPIPGL